MKIVKFLDKTWQEIPELDNPAMQCNMINDPDNFGALIHPECIMIFKGSRDVYCITDGGFVVAIVPKEGDIIKLGVFWSAKNAELFAEMIFKAEAPELFTGTHKALTKLTKLSKL
jgi:hypothetical protein